MKNHDELHLCGDDSRCATASYFDTWAGVTDVIENKPDVKKAVQTIMIGCANSNRPCAYIQIHKLQKNLTGWTVMGQIEVNNLMDQLKPMVEREYYNEKSK